MARKAKATRPVGRPQVHDREALRTAFFAYIDGTDIPIVSEFAYQHGLNRTSVYEIPELLDCLKACITKKEAALERQCLSGKIDRSMAIFSLKQLGWKDNTNINLGGQPENPMRAEVKVIDEGVSQAQALEAYLDLVKRKA